MSVGTPETVLGALAVELRRELTGGDENWAYAWASRLLALQCMEARGLVDEVVLQKAARAATDDELFTILFDGLARLATELPFVFDPRAPELLVRPPVATLRRCLSLLSGTDEAWKAPDALGWAYQHWNGEEKTRVFDTLRTTKGAKIGGTDLVPASCIYTKAYMVRFLVQNSLGAIWLAMHPESRLRAGWEYFVDEARPEPRPKRPVRGLTFLDPACGSGHFLLEAFDVFYSMYLEEGELSEPAEICASILENNLFGIDIDERAVRIAACSLVLRAKERAPAFVSRHVNLVATKTGLATPREHVASFLEKYPGDRPFETGLTAVFEGLARAAELGSLVRVEEAFDSVGAEGVLARLRTYFREGAGGVDTGSRMFGEAAATRVTLVDLVTRRYDVIAMNPPYIGFRKLAPHLKEHLALDELTKLDIYVAFLSRFFSRLADGGRLAAVTPASWTTSSTVLPLRRKMLDEGGPCIVAALGQRVFEGAPLLYVSLSVMEREAPRARARFVTLRPAPFSGGAGLRAAVEGTAKAWPHSIINALPTLPFLPVAPLELLEAARGGPTVGTYFSFADGAWTGSNDRDVRETWEVPDDESRWVSASGGQGYCRWHAPVARRMRVSAITTPPAAAARAGALEYSRVAGGKLAARVVTSPSEAIAGIVSMLPKDREDRGRLLEVAAVFNSRIGTVWLRTLTSGLNFNPGYAASIPLGARPPAAELARAVDEVVQEKVELKAWDLVCDGFRPSLFTTLTGDSPRERAHAFCERVLAMTSSLLTRENDIERHLKDHFVLSDDAWSEIDRELGKPVAAFSDADTSPLPFPGASPNVSIEDAEDDDEAGGAVSLPPESDLERLARATGIAPRGLLARKDLPAGIDAQMAEVRRAQWTKFAEDYLSVLVLQLLGYRWPSDPLGERLDARPDAGDDGIVPLTPSAGEPAIIERLHRVLAVGFPAVPKEAVEREFRELLGKPIESWLVTEFFRHHTAQFARRPIVWQLQSGRYGAARKPAFAALIYCRRLDADTLPKLRSQHVGARIVQIETELGAMGAPTTSDRPALRTRREEREAALRELYAFDAKLEAVVASGFACDALDALAPREPPEVSTFRDGVAVSPSPRALFRLQESRYDPAIDDGVRVNIAPLQKAGLLAAEVLTTKDLEKAIADRAEWRAGVRHSHRTETPPQQALWPAKSSP